MDFTEACSGFKTQNRALTTFPQDKSRAAARKKCRLFPSPNNSLMALSFSVARHRKSPGPSVSMIMYSLLFDFLMGFCLIIITWLLKCAAEREPGSVKTKGGQILRCWHVACAALVSPSAFFCAMIDFPLEHDVNMLTCLSFIKTPSN